MDDQPPEPVIDGRVKLTAEVIAKMNKALEATQGGREAAAEILGCTKTKLDMAIRHIPALNARWKTEKDLRMGAVDSDNVEEVVNRTPPRALALTEEQKMATALSVNEKKINRSLAKLGFKQAEIQAISSIEEFAGEHFTQTLSILHGGMVKSAMRLMILAERIEQTYLQDDVLDEQSRKWWWDQYFRILEQLRSMNDQSNKAALTKAMIEIKRKEQGSLGKPGFSQAPLVNINVGQNPSIKEARKPEGWTPPPAPESSTP